MNTFSTEIVYPISADIAYCTKDTVLCVFSNDSVESIRLGRSGFLGYIWDDGSYDSFRIVYEPGVYWVMSLNEGCGAQIDTFNVKMALYPHVNLGEDRKLCTYGIPLSIDMPLDSLRWSDGSTLRAITATSSVSYWVEVSADGCTSSDTVRLLTHEVD